MKRVSTVSTSGLETHTAKISPDVERFISKLDENEQTGCLLYTGAKTRGKTSSGYGVFDVSGHSYLAHRWAFEAFNRTKIPEGMLVGHSSKCTSLGLIGRSCCNPDHLSLLTPSQNQQQRGTDKTLGVQRRKYIKATPQEIDEIRAAYKAGASAYSLALKWNRSETWVGHVVKGHLHDPSKPKREAKLKIVKKKSPKPTPISDAVVGQEAA